MTSYFSFACRRRLLLELSPLGASSEGGAMSDLVFTSYTTSASTHLTHRLYHMKETQAHRKIRLKNCPEGSETAPTSPRRRHHPKVQTRTLRADHVAVGSRACFVFSSMSHDNHIMQ